MTKMQKAGQSEAAFLVAAFQRGFEISKPLHHAQAYDFVIRRPGHRDWETVQVKTAYQGKTGAGMPTREVSLRRCNEKGSRPYEDGDFDLLFVVDGKAAWLLPWSVISERRSCVVIGSKRYAAFRF